MSNQEVTEKENKDPQVSFATSFALRRLIGKFAIITYDDMEAIKAKATKLDEAASQFNDLHRGDQAKANEMFNSESSIKKSDLAYLTKEDFKQAIFQRGFDFDQANLLEYWFVKN